MTFPISNASARVAMPTPHMKPEDAFKKVDSGNKGFITESDLASAIVQISPEGLSLSQADAQAIAKDAFSRMDANADGEVNSMEFKDAAPQNAPQGGPPGGHPSGPPPGPRSGGSAGGSSEANGAAGAGTSQSFDAADTNQDGMVSELELLAYTSTSQAANASDSAAKTPK